MKKWSDHLNDINKNLYKKRVAIFSLAVSVVLVLAKILVAYYSNSISVFSEALNNGLDLVTVLMTLLAVRIATRPADKDHTYGHGKYENLSAFFEIIIITLLSVFIIFKSIQRLINRSFILNLNNYVFYILIASIIINIIRVYFIGSAAKRFNSMAFRADFINYSSDAISSVIVIIGLLLAKRGFYLADPIASIIVSIIIIGFSIRLLLKIIRNFLDYIPVETTEKVSKMLENFPEISRVYDLKIHEVGDTKFISADLGLNDNIYISQIEKIKEKIRKEIAKNLPGSEVMIEFRPALSRDNIDCVVKEVLLNQDSVNDIHNIFIYNVGKQLDISVHIELSKSFNLEDADKLTDKTEEILKKRIENLRNIYIHIEDARINEEWDDVTQQSEILISKIKDSISLIASPDTCHKFTVLEKSGHINIAFHCRLDRNLGIGQAHSAVTEMENIVKNISNNISEVSIHVEPI